MGHYRFRGMTFGDLSAFGRFGRPYPHPERWFLSDGPVSGWCPRTVHLDSQSSVSEGEYFAGSARLPCRPPLLPGWSRSRPLPGRPPPSNKTIIGDTGARVKVSPKKKCISPKKKSILGRLGVRNSFELTKGAGSDDIGMHYICSVCGLPGESQSRGRPRKRHPECSTPCGHSRRPARKVCECGCGPLPANCRSNRRFATWACRRRARLALQD